MQLAATHTALYEGVSLDDLALGIPFSKRWGMVLRVSGVLMDRTARTDVSGTDLGTYTSNAFSAGAGLYGSTEKWSFGIFGKSLQQKIDGYSASGFAADAGLQYRTPIRGMTLGVACLHLGKPVTFVQQTDDLPRAVRAGIGYDKGFLKIGVDGVRYVDQPVFLCAGLELSLFGGLRLRAGYSDQSDLSSAFKAGIGFRFSALDLSYAYDPGVEMGASHRVTLTVR